jgi:hypothetical protein
VPHRRRATAPATPEELVEAGRQAKERSGASEWIRAVLRSAFVENAALKLVAFLLALTLFILVHSDEDTLQPVTVPLRYVAPPPGLTLVNEPPSQVRVTVKGSRRRLKRLDESELDPILVTLTNTGEFIFQPRMVRPLPAGVEVASISPSSVSLEYERSVAKRVPIRPRTTGAPAAGFRVEEIRVEPADIEIHGAESALAKTSELVTQQIPIDGATEPITEMVALEDPAASINVVVGDGSPEPPAAVEVKVTVDVVRAQGVLELPAREVEIVGVSPTAAAGWETSPATVELILRGPRLALDLVEPTAVGARVQLLAGDVSGRDSRRAPVFVSGVPEGVAVEVRPRQVELRPR